MLAAELAAARAFPRLDGATVLHVRYHGGGFAAGEAALTPAQFHQQVTSRLGLPPGQPVILAAPAAPAAALAAPAAAGGAAAAAAELAVLAGVPVVGARGAGDDHRRRDGPRRRD